MTSRLLVMALALALTRTAHADPDDAVYRQALAAFTDGDYTAALSLAIRTVQLGGPHKLEAKFLYGDTLFRTGQYERARGVYLALRAVTSGDQRAIAQKKLAAVNRRLALPEDDSGVAPPPPAAPSFVGSRPGDELYARAIAAVRRSDLDGARELAVKAAVEDGAHKIDAKVLYGDLLARRGEHARAKDVFVALRRLTTGDVRAIVTAKVVAENRALSLPDTDGVVD